MRTISTIFIYLSIAAVLSGCLAGAVMRVREAAARADCMNNLKQIGLGWHNMLDCLDRYPAATVESELLPPERRLSWTVDASYFIESMAFPRIDRDKPWDDPSNEGWTRIKYQTFLCRANPVREINGLPLSHFVGIAGIGRDAANRSLDEPEIGLFNNHPRTKAKNLSELHSSNTVLLIETTWDNGPWMAAGRPTVRGFEQGHERPYVGKDAQFGGLHRGGTNMLFADGTVRLISNTIDPLLLESMATITGAKKLNVEDVEGATEKP